MAVQTFSIGLRIMPIEDDVQAVSGYRDRAERVEARGPEVLEGLQPGIECGEFARFEPIEPSLTVGPHADEGGVAQQLEVFGDSELAEPRCLHEVAHRPLSGAEQIEQLAASVRQWLRADSHLYIRVL